LRGRRKYDSRDLAENNTRVSAWSPLKRTSKLHLISKRATLRSHIDRRKPSDSSSILVSKRAKLQAYTLVA
jgi:hypothetical protein